VHWVALHFPQFRRQALSHGHALPEPERQALAAIAAWACQFTPRVSLEPPQTLLLEVAGSLHFLGNRWRFLAQLRAGLKRLGFEARIAEAPTARAALWQARGNGGRLEAQSVGVMEAGPEAAALLSSLGVHTLGGLMRLPREGLARRFDARVLAQLDQARGLAAEAREFFVLPEQFGMQLEMPAPVEQADQVLFVARRMLDQMEGFLTARQAGVRSFTLRLLHEDPPATAVDIRLAALGRGAEHFLRLLRERLAALPLRAPVEAIGIEAGAIESLAEWNRDLFRHRAENREDWLHLVERLQARLGISAVHQLDTREDHRPEHAWAAVAPGRTSAPKEETRLAPRPVWLLERPRRLAEGDFTLLAGPERIESGWWDEAEAKRDYFVARTGKASLAWIYREREGSWFLHGYFA
jgi:protein ImuB